MIVGEAVDAGPVVVVVAVGAVGAVKVPLKLYISSRLLPPQNSEPLPLQTIPHSATPSGASSPPLDIKLPHPDRIINMR